MPDPAEAVWQVLDNEYKAYTDALRRVAREVLQNESDFQKARRRVFFALQGRLERSGLPEPLASSLADLDGCSGGQALLSDFDPREMRHAIRRYADGQGAAPEDALANYMEAGLGYLHRLRRVAFELVATDFERRQEEERRNARILERGEVHFIHRPNMVGGCLVPHLGREMDYRDLEGFGPEEVREAAKEPDLVLGLDVLVKHLCIFRDQGRPPPRVFLHDLLRTPREDVRLTSLASEDYWCLLEHHHRRACLGTVEVQQDGGLVLNGSFRLLGGLKTLARWEQACRTRLWASPASGDRVEGFEAVAQDLVKQVIPKRPRPPRGPGPGADRRARRLFVELLGEEALRELEQNGSLPVEARDGRKFTIDLEGEVRDSAGRQVCVHGGGGLPRLEKVLARYLVLRDRPEAVVENDAPRDGLEVPL